MGLNIRTIESAIFARVLSIVAALLSFVLICVGTVVAFGGDRNYEDSFEQRSPEPTFIESVFPTDLQFAASALSAVASDVGFLIILAGAIAFAFAKTFGQRVDDIKAKRLFASLSDLDSLQSTSSPKRKYILYLRPFDSTRQIAEIVKNKNATVGTAAGTYELEAQLRKACRNWMPVLGLGRSLEMIGGVSRIELSDDDWQGAALTLIQNASLIVLVPVENPGTLWELEQILLGAPKRRTVFVNEYEGWTPDGSPFVQRDDWSRLSGLFEAHGLSLPAFDNLGRLVFFGTSSKPVLTAPLELTKSGKIRRFLKRAHKLSRAA
jgi:hypothetical protein